jgi:lysophospholipase L1-like esterase
MKSVLLKILAVLLSLIIAFGIAEIAVRTLAPHQVSPVWYLVDPQFGEIPTPGQRGRKIFPGAYDHTYTNNSMGFRGRKEYRFPKTTDFRILFLGDSFTYGLGVNDDQTFPFLVEQQLLQDRLSVEVINAGNNGKGTDYELRFFQVRGAKFNPDLTVVCFFCNDFADNERGEYFKVAASGELTPKPPSQSWRFFKKLLFSLPGYNWLCSWSQAVNLAKDEVAQLYIRNLEPGDRQAGGLVIHYPDIDTGYANEHRKKLTETY